MLALLWYDVSMLRTRDFILVFVSVGFLVLAVGVTWVSQDNNPEASSVLQFNETNTTEFTADTYVPAELSRAERVAQMRQKIANSDAVIVSADESVVESDVLDDVLSEDQEMVLSVLQQCSTYSPFVGAWPAQGLLIEQVEGARVAYTQSVITAPIDPLSTSTVVQMPIVERKILLQLSASPFITSSPSCIASDVIGVAQDGSLIRNNEAGLYGVFGSQTRIGFALDGHPIYGVTDLQTDMCGGAMVDGLYGYYLSEDRDTVLNCFMSKPVTIATVL